MSYSDEIKRQKDLGRAPGLVLLCAAVYMISYLARVNYSAVTVEIIADTGFSKSAVSIPLTALFVTYGFGQIVCGFLGDRISPEKMIFWGLIITCAMNLLLPFAGSIAFMTVIWGINGFAQAMMWPPIVKILTGHLTPAQYSKHIVLISYSCSVGTIITYLMSSLFVQFASWKTVFFFSAVCAGAVAAVWAMTAGRLERRLEKQLPAEKTAAGEKKAHMPVSVRLLLGVIIAAVAAQGVLRDGIATWMPTYITDVFKVDSTVSILTGIALPIFTILVTAVAAFLYRRIFKNEATCAVIFFVLCALSCGLLSLFSASGALLSVTLLMVANAASHGVNSMFTSMVIPKFASYGKTAFITGLINSATYVGSAVSMYGVALITENFGWTATIVTWLFFSAAGVILSALAVRPLKKLSDA